MITHSTIKKRTFKNRCNYRLNRWYAWKFVFQYPLVTKYKMALCLGPIGSGKTLLLRKLQNVNNVDKTTPSVSTIGTNLFDIKFGDGTQISIRELGGMMAPLWKNYFSNINKVIYVVDASNLCQISAAGVLLYTILVHPALRSAKVIQNRG